MALSYEQRRFLHQNPSFIHNIQSDARAAAGARRGMAMEAAREQEGGGYYRGNAWISPMTEGAEEADAVQQVNHLRDEIARQGEIVQSGSHVFSPEEIRERQQVSQASLAALDSMSPFVASGMVDADTIRKAVGQVATDQFNDQRNLRTASRDFQELQKAFNGGTFSVEQASGVMQQLEKQYGKSVLLRVPGYAEAVGVQGQYEQAKNELVQQATQQYGVPFRWDDRQNRPVRDDEAVTSMFAERQLAELDAEAADMPRRLQLEALKTKLTAVSKAIASKEAQGLDASQLYKQFDKLVNEQFMAAGGQQKPAVAAPQAAPNQSMQDAVQTKPQTFNEPNAIRYGSTDEFEAAAKRGDIKINKPYPVGNRRVILQPNGKFKWVS